MHPQTTSTTTHQQRTRIQVTRAVWLAASLHCAHEGEVYFDGRHTETERDRERERVLSLQSSFFAVGSGYVLCNSRREAAHPRVQPKQAVSLMVHLVRFWRVCPISKFPLPITCARSGDH